jgi:hypothetical protein
MEDQPIENTPEITEKKKSRALDPAIAKSKQCNFKVVPAKMEDYKKKAAEINILNFSLFLETMCDKGVETMFSGGKPPVPPAPKKDPEIKEKIVYVDKIKEVEKVVYRDGNIFSKDQLEKFNKVLEKRIASGKSKDLAQFLEQCFNTWKEVSW